MEINNIQLKEGILFVEHDGPANTSLRLVVDTFQLNAVNQSFILPKDLPLGSYPLEIQALTEDETLWQTYTKITLADQLVINNAKDDNDMYVRLMSSKLYLEVVRSEYSSSIESSYSATVTIDANHIVIQNLNESEQTEWQLEISRRKLGSSFIFKGDRTHNQDWYFNWSEWLQQIFNIQKGMRFDLVIQIPQGNSIRRYRLNVDGNARNSSVVVDERSKTIYQQGIQAYQTKDKEWSLFKNSPHRIWRERLQIQTCISTLRKDNGGYSLTAEISGDFSSDFQITNTLLIQRNRLAYQSLSVPYTIEQRSKQEREIHIHIPGQLNLSPFYWDTYIEIVQDGQVILVQLEGTSTRVQGYVKRHVYNREIYTNNAHVFYPYITSINENLAFEYRPLEVYETQENLRKERLAYWVALLLKPYFKWRKPWIVYEKNAMGAHDNGFHFFKYLYEKQPQVAAYYVINDASPEYENVQKMGKRVIPFMSFRYFLHLYGAHLLISSDTKYHVYNLHRRDSWMAKALAKKKNIFLQHGVNGFKKVPGFHKQRGLLDFIIAPSYYEKDKITVPIWGYEPDEVAVTGYARWDAYEDKTHLLPHHQIFVMPTWRKWMDGMSRDDFVKTPFYAEYQKFLSSPDLKMLLQKNHVRIAFFLHPYFKNYVDLFDIDESIIDRYGYLDVDMGEEIMKSSMMITDYSSVAWDMYYLKKPVVFYQFDQSDYLKTEGAYLDYNEDLFGDATFSAIDTVAAIQKYIQRDFQEEAQYIEKRTMLLPFVDQQNAQRIYEAIKNYR